MAGTENSGEEVSLLDPSTSGVDVDVDGDVPITTMSKKVPVASKKRSAKNKNDEEPPNIKKRSTRTRIPVQKYAPPSPLTKQRSSKEKSTDSVDKTEEHEAAGTTIEENTLSGNDGEASEDTKKIAKDEKESMSCPHCQKSFTSEYGLKYHVEKKVCLRTKKATGDEVGHLESEESVKKKPKRESQAKETKVKKKKSTHECPRCNKIFGNLFGFKYHTRKNVCLSGSGKKAATDENNEMNNELKPCPHCEQTFKSLPGLKYHLDNKVCSSDGRIRPGSILQSVSALSKGDRFVTKWGVVEVVSDTYTNPLIDNKMTEASWKEKKKQKTKLESKAKQNEKRFWVDAAGNRLRRLMLQNLYLAAGRSPNIRQNEIWKCYLGHYTPPQQSEYIPSETEQNEGCVEGADRIVECIFVPDERPKVYDLGGKNSSEVVLPSKTLTASASPMRLYLPRRDLCHHYTAVKPVFCCSKCGQDFISQPREHVKGNVCEERAKREAEKRQELVEQVDELVRERWTRVENRKSKDRKKTKKKTIKKEPPRNLFPSMYPQVFESLGFRFGSIEKNSNSRERLRRQVREMKKKAKEKAQNIRRRLREKLKQHNTAPSRISNTKKRKKEDPVEENECAPPKRRRLGQDEVEPLNEEIIPVGPKDLLSDVIIDVSVFSEEIDKGRYPSIQRFYGNHEDACNLCRNEESGKLYKCAVCSNSQHIPCMLTIALLRNPDPAPDDDFFCVDCIRTIVRRRDRAEQRIIEKQQKAVWEESGEANRLANHDSKEEKERKMPVCPQGGPGGLLCCKECSTLYERHMLTLSVDIERKNVEKETKQLQELIELAEHAQCRLRQMLEESTANKKRRRYLLLEKDSVEIKSDDIVSEVNEPGIEEKTSLTE